MMPLNEEWLELYIFLVKLELKKTDVASAFPLELAFSSGDGNGLGLVGFLI